MKKSEMILKDTRGDEHMKVIYDHDSLQIQEIQLWDDIANCFVEIKPVWRYKRDHFDAYEKICAKVRDDYYNHVMGEADRCDDNKYQNYKDMKVAR